MKIISFAMFWLDIICYICFKYAIKNFMKHYVLRQCLLLTNGTHWEERRPTPSIIRDLLSVTCYTCNLHFLFFGISGNLRRRLSPGPGRCCSPHVVWCAWSSPWRGRLTPEPGVPLPLLGCRLPSSSCAADPVLVVGLQHTGSSSPSPSSLFDDVDESSSSRISWTNLQLTEDHSH